MGNTLKIKIKTLSNLFIGGAPRPFEIGGIDQWTAVDHEGFPCIPASSLKGALRAIVAEDKSPEALKIRQWYVEFLKNDKRETWKQCKDLEDALVERVESRYKKAGQNASPAYLFGIKEFNNTPKLLFNDLKLKDEYRNPRTCFSIDMKTSIHCEGAQVRSNPRTYKTAAPGLEFEGEIEFYRFGQKPFDEAAIDICRQFLTDNLNKFNEGIYRLGNSKSRGYGKIQVSVIEKG